MPSKEEMILQTQKWVLEVVVGTNFCPFAAKEVKNKTIRYAVAEEGTKKEKLDTVLSECALLDAHAEIETTLLLFPNEFPNFLDFLDFVDAVERRMNKKGYEGIYQVASFHPEYCFEGSDENDAANYTNRSIYPMLHLLREESLERALETFPNPENIPNRNINFARKKGLAYMKLLREQCM
jgi:uncharacterized protein